MTVDCIYGGEYEGISLCFERLLTCATCILTVQMLVNVATFAGHGVRLYAAVCAVCCVCFLRDFTTYQSWVHRGRRLAESCSAPPTNYLLMLFDPKAGVVC